VNIAARRLSVSAQLQDSGGLRAIVAGTTIVLYLAVFALLFPDAAAGALRVWIVSPTFNHCFLVLPVSLFMIWHRRSTLGAVTFRPEWRGLAIIFAAGLLWMTGRFAGILEARQFAVLTMLQAALLSTLGAAAYRKMAAPFLYLYFLVPTGDYLVPVLQAFTARFAVIGLHVLHIPVFSNGTVIDVPAGTFAVAEACAGLRFLIASLAFGAFFATITYKSWFRRAIFVSLCAIVPVVANGFRALGLIAAAEWVGNPAAALADHVIYGWIFFSLILIMLIVIGQLFSDQADEHRLPMENAPLFVASNGVLACAISGVLAVVSASFAPAAAAWLDRREGANVPDFRPLVALPWHEVASSGDWKPLAMPGSRSFLQSFSDGSRRVDRFVVVYSGPASRHVVRSNDRDADERIWNFETAEDSAVVLGRDIVPVRVSLWRRGSELRTIWSFYLIDGHAVSNIWAVKWTQLTSYISGTGCGSAYGAVSTIHREGEPPDTGAMKEILSATYDMRRYLCASTTRR
jgi:exosortase A